MIGPTDVETAQKSWRWPSFTPKEMACKHCNTVKVDETFMDELQNLRDQFGAGLIVTSGYRCPDHNASVSSTGRNGPHTTGRAVDLGVMGGVAMDVVRIALDLDFTGLGVNQKGSGRFIHLDTLENADGCPRQWMWSY